MINSPRQTASKRRGPIVCCCGTPLVLALCLVIVYAYNNRLPDIKVPTHSVPADNGAIYLKRAYRLMDKMKHGTPYDMAGPQDFTYANFQSCAADAKPVLDMMQQALHHQFMCPSVIDPTLNDYPNTSELRELERVNAGAADFYALSGHPDRAMELRLNGVELGAVVPRGGTIITDSVGRACEAISMSGIEPLIPRLNSAGLKLAAAHIDHITARRSPFSEIVREQGYYQAREMLMIFRESRGTESHFEAAKNLLSVDDDDSVPSRADQARLMMQVLKYTVSNKSAMLQRNQTWFEAVAREAETPFTGKFKVDVPENLFAQMEADTLNMARAKHTAMEAQVAVLRAEIALYRYKLANRRFPATLANLCPTYLPSIPTDPCGGGPNKPLKYSLKPDGTFLLYSLGPDMKDDGGIPAKRVGDLGGDVVAGKLHKYGPILYTGQTSKTATHE